MDNLVFDELVDYVCRSRGYKRNYFTEYMIRHNLSQAKLAEKLGVSKQNLCNWLHKDESEWSDSVRALVRVIRSTKYELV